MSIIINIGILFWHVWFVFCTFTLIILLLPFLVIIISKEKWFPIYFKIARIWSKTLLFIMGFTINNFLKTNYPLFPFLFLIVKKDIHNIYFSGRPGTLRVKIHKFIPTLKRELAQTNQIKNETYQVIYNALSTDKSYMISTTK